MLHHTRTNARSPAFHYLSELDGVVDVDELFSCPQEFDKILRAAKWTQWGPILTYLSDDLFENCQTEAARGLSATAVRGSRERSRDDRPAPGRGRSGSVCTRRGGDRSIDILVVLDTDELETLEELIDVLSKAV